MNNGNQDKLMLIEKLERKLMDKEAELNELYDILGRLNSYIKNIIDDMYPAKTAGRPLIEQMVETGKRLYLLDAFLPEIADSLKTGYTQQQLDGCYGNQKNIWAFFVENNLLYETESTLVGPYVNDGPNTPELGTSSPGFIGQFIGWQIVKRWMERNEKISLTELMKKNPKELFDESKYRPG